jgi:hypothetical protein
MKRMKGVFFALGALLLSVGTVAAFSTMPEAAGPGLQKASEHSGKTVPVRSAPDQAPPAPAAAPAEDATAPADLPDAASHGAAVSAVATADDATPDTNHGADVSAVAKDNKGQATAAQHRPATAGKPADAGKPDGAGKPDDPGQPENPGKP